MWVHTDETGASQVADYLRSLSQAEQKQILAVLMNAAMRGPTWDEAVCRKLEGEAFFEFKARRGQRVFWHWAPGWKMVAFHGATKKQQKTPAKELKAGRAAHIESLTESLEEGAEWID